MTDTIRSLRAIEPPMPPPPGDDGYPWPDDGDRSEFRHTDVGNAHRLVAAHGAEIRHVGPWGAWLIWDGRRWREDTRGEIIERAKKVAADLFDQALRIPDADDRKKAVKWAFASEAAARIEAMVKLARSHPAVAVDPQELDSDDWLLNLANGTVDLRSGVLRPHDPRDHITKLAGARYRHDAAAPRWLEFLEQILPDADVREFVRRWAGYCLTGAVTEHKIVFAFGAGANGKSTLLNVLAHVLGEYARQAPPDLLMRRRDDPHPTGLADLHGARLVLASETQQGRHLDEALVKRLTGGDAIKARKMHKDFFEFQPTHKLVVATNHRPGIEGTDHGIWRRIRLVPFGVVIADDQQDHLLEQKLKEEAEGVLQWAIAGCITWAQGGLTEPAEVIAATADYRAEMDILGEFISDTCVLVDGVSARAADLYSAYERWCEAAGERPLSARRFGTNLRERGLEKYRSNGIWWRGIGLQTERSADSGERERAGQKLWDP
jgi:putative DNA primase/helicase